MPGLDPEEYRVLLNKCSRIAEAVMQGADNEARHSFAVCFAEIYSQSKWLLEEIDKIAAVNLDLSENDLDKLLADLVMAKIIMYDELRCWMRQLRRPLQTAMDRVEDMLPPDESE